MKVRPLLTTGEVAAFCQVSVKTVNNWIKSGHLRSAITPGRHHRIAVEDFNAFLRAHDLPLFGDAPEPKRRVLVVDDEAEVVRVIAGGLLKTGLYEVASAADGFDAGIQVARFGPDLVILDLMMPKLDGFAVCQLIKSNPETSHIKVVVLTGHASEENKERARKCGADAFLAKPQGLRQLREHLDTLLAARPLTHTA
jgi:excisionase family DNA binding protein